MSQRKRVVITCGPAIEPIDRVRRITNHSTGRLGALLASRLAREGFDVTCLRGEAASYVAPGAPVRVVPFSTNNDLRGKLERIEQRERIHAVLHAAALCDFRVKTIGGGEGGAKLSSRAGELTLTLEPAAKVLPHLRALFPHAKIVGWKYELDGDSAGALAKGARQVADCGTDACVVNGDAYGDGYGFLERGQPHWHFDDTDALCGFIAEWLAQPA